MAHAVGQQYDEFDLTAELAAPRIFQINPIGLPDTWPEFCLEQKIRAHGVLMYENALEQQKLWAAAGVIAAGIRCGKHLVTDTIIDSTSGNYGEALAYVIQELRRRLPWFQVMRVIAVVPKNLPEGKRERLVRRGIKLVYAENSIDAQRVAQELAEREGHWYTRQYWDVANCHSYHRVGAHIAKSLPHLGAIACGVGSGGSFAGTVAAIEEAFAALDAIVFRAEQKLHRIAVAVEPGHRVAGVRDPIGLAPGTLPWRLFADDVRLIGSAASLKFSHALWNQGCIAGPSSGFALVGGLLSLHMLWLLQRLDPLRGPDDFIDLAVLFPDTRKPYREEYEEAGYVLPSQEEWDLPLAA